jgi:hypothetical protein
LLKKASEVLGCSFHLYSVSVQAADPTLCDPWPIEIGYGGLLLGPHYTRGPRGGVVKKVSSINKTCYRIQHPSGVFQRT